MTPNNISTGWNDNIAELSEHITNDDIQKFLKWRVVKYTMFVGNSPYIAKELFFLLTHNWKKWKRGIHEHSFGSPTPFILYPWSSGNLIHNAHHLAQFENITHQNITDFDYVFEFGGGYGSMARLFHNLGFKGKYIIYDLPEFSQLQKIYLDKIGMKNVEFVTRIEGIPNSNGKVFFIATWSLSEAPLDLRNQILDKVTANSYLFAYQRSFDVFNNIDYFNKFRNELKLKWYDSEIKHIPDNYYLFGSDQR